MYLPSCCTSAGCLHYHAEKSAHICGMVLPVCSWIPWRLADDKSTNKPLPDPMLTWSIVQPVLIIISPTSSHLVRESTQAPPGGRNDPYSLQWRHNERNGISNHHPHNCLFNHIFRRRSKKTSKLRVTGLCEGNSPVTGELGQHWLR